MVFSISIIGYLLFSISDTYTNYIEKPVSNLYGKVCSLMLPLIGYKAESKELNLIGDGFEMSIATGCDAIMPLVFLSLIIILSPYGSLKYKLKGISLGFLFIVLSNIIRLCSLFILGHHSQFWFDFFHVQFWQAYFILLTLMFFIFWLKNIKS
ncbi:MAG: archaeosortase/exosortase family protein [Saprospiraceae bacterium]|nr:archaeosortase/exosortase family protein [Saprospiraceae bacterium]